MYECVCVTERERQRGRKEIFSRPGLNQKGKNSFAKNKKTWAILLHEIDSFQIVLLFARQ